MYVFGEKDENIIPVYVGISRDIFKRLKQHGWGKTHNAATLAYLIADKEFRYNSNVRELGFSVVSKSQRKHIENEADVPKAKELVRRFKVAIYPIENDYELYFHEVAVAGILQSKWNSFRTH